MCKNEIVVYNDLIKRGLIVKDGMHYGAKFNVYEEEPERCHSYCLIYTCHSGQRISIKDLVCWTRVSAFNNKEGIIAFVNCIDKTVKYASIKRFKLQ